MSIIDSPYGSQAEFLAALEVAKPLVEVGLARRNLTPVQRRIIELMREGFSFADIFNISEAERDGVLAVARQLLTVGDFARARAVLFTLLEIEPGDSRVLYALAGCYQGEGKLAAAAQLYTYFLARDATNPQGYLRLGECFYAAKEFVNARDSFRIALIEAERADGSLRTKDYARRMMAEAETALAAASE
jgi:tetratricopeptide (TPR) repeat protein